MKKPKIVILKRLYSVADPIIRYMPGRNLEEKRTLFNAVLIVSIVSFYLSPLPIIILSTVRTSIISAILAFMMLVPLPLVFVKYLLELMVEYGDRWRSFKTRDNATQKTEDKNT